MNDARFRQSSSIAASRIRPLTSTDVAERRPALVVATGSAPLDCSDPALFEPPGIEVRKLAPPSLRYVDVPRVSDLSRYVHSESKAIRLGKALFWDMQSGSDGMACASCHFNAGTDSRIRNQLSPGLLAKGSPDTTFQATASGASGGPNYTVKKADFPFHQFDDPDDRSSGVKFTTNDVLSASGTFSGLFEALPGQDELNDICGQFAEPVFNVGGHATRKVEPRQTPSVINAVFNFRNFWDGRANNVFNGADPFGKRSGNVRVYDRYGNPKTVHLRNSSLASQAVGTIQSPLEMICNGRTLSDLGRKLLPRKPLAFQEIHRDDSVLGRYRDRSGRGLSQTYESLIKEAFESNWWAGSGNYGGYNQMEANFSLFWGLAIQMYQATLISDEAPYDSFAYCKSEEFEPSDGRTHKLSSSAYRGLKVFLDKGKCINCHSGPEFSGAASSLQRHRATDVGANESTGRMTQSTRAAERGGASLAHHRSAAEDGAAAGSIRSSRRRRPHRPRVDSQRTRAKWQLPAVFSTMYLPTLRYAS